MPRKIASTLNTASRASTALLKPAAVAALAATALAAIVWLAVASPATGSRNLSPGSLVEFMRSPAAGNVPDPIPHDHITARGEWRLPPPPPAGDAWTALSARKYPQQAAIVRDVRKPDRADFELPEVGRNPMPRASENAASRRVGTPGWMVDAGHPLGLDVTRLLRSSAREGNPVSVSRGSTELRTRGSPALTLAIARGTLDAPGAVPATGDAGGGETMQSPRFGAKSGRTGTVSSADALANLAGDYPAPSVDDLFSLKLRGEYGISKANLADNSVFEDRFVVLGGEKKFDFAGMDQMKLKLDGVITTGGYWDYPSMKQDLSGVALNVGPEIKFPELPIKMNINLGAGMLKRKATLSEDNLPFGIMDSRADIDSLVYGGGAAMRGDWQWRMFTITGLAGVQYAAAADKEHTYKSGNTIFGKVAKETRSAWEVPLQLRIGGEYRLLNALSVLPSLWGGYTFNITGKNGLFRNGHIAGAESTWRRHGLTWNHDSYHVGGELRLRALDRFDLWFAYQKEWAGDNSGSYLGGGLQVAF